MERLGSKGKSNSSSDLKTPKESTERLYSQDLDASRKENQERPNLERRNTGKPKQDTLYPTTWSGLVLSSLSLLATDQQTNKREPLQQEKCPMKEEKRTENRKSIVVKDAKEQLTDEVPREREGTIVSPKSEGQDTIPRSQLELSEPVRGSAKEDKRRQEPKSILKAKSTEQLTFKPSRERKATLSSPPPESKVTIPSIKVAAPEPEQNHTKSDQMRDKHKRTVKATSNEQMTQKLPQRRKSTLASPKLEIGESTFISKPVAMTSASTSQPKEKPHDARTGCKTSPPNRAADTKEDKQKASRPKPERKSTNPQNRVNSSQNLIDMVASSLIASITLEDLQKLATGKVEEMLNTRPQPKHTQSSPPLTKRTTMQESESRAVTDRFKNNSKEQKDKARAATKPSSSEELIDDLQRLAFAKAGVQMHGKDGKIERQKNLKSSDDIIEEVQRIAFQKATDSMHESLAVTSKAEGGSSRAKQGKLRRLPSRTHSMNSMAVEPDLTRESKDIARKTKETARDGLTRSITDTTVVAKPSKKALNQESLTSTDMAKSSKTPTRNSSKTREPTKINDAKAAKTQGRPTESGLSGSLPTSLPAKGEIFGHVRAPARSRTRAKEGSEKGLRPVNAVR